MFQSNLPIDLPFKKSAAASTPEAQLRELMESYPCYAFVSNHERTGARALFRGRWSYEAVTAYFTDAPATIVVNDERASGFMRYRFYTTEDGCPVCLAEIEVYFARGEGRTSFWCHSEEATGALSLAA